MDERDTWNLTEHTLEWLRTADADNFQVLSTALGIQLMGPADWCRTKHEIRDYIASGDVAEARALIQHASARRKAARRISSLD